MCHNFIKEELNLKDIKSFEGRYAIEEDGRVWSYLTNKYLKQQEDKDGYLVVKLRDYKNGTYVTKFIHRLIAEAYMPNPNNKETVDHIDGNKQNNKISNLQWASRYEQTQNINWQKKMRKPVICIETGKFYSGITQVHNELGLNLGHLSECVHGKRNICGGYHWRYATLQEAKDNNWI